MKNLKLTIDLVPETAWGENLRKLLRASDWDILRHTAYEKTNHKCSICETPSDNLEAHEVWNYDISFKTQTLTDIIALCKSCHFVKHIRQAKRIGAEKHAQSHFLKINNCGFDTFASHFLEAEQLLKDSSKVEEWTLVLPPEIEELSKLKIIRKTETKEKGYVQNAEKRMRLLTKFIQKEVS